jgi:hypothetical protein
MTTTTTVATSTTRILPHWKEVEIQSYSVRTTTKKSGNAIARSFKFIKSLRSFSN